MNDKKSILNYHSDYDANKYQGWIPKNLADVEVFIEKLATHTNQTNKWYQLAIIEKNSGLMIGDIGIHLLETGSQQVEIGYTLDKHHQKKGYAAEALKRVIDFIFCDLNKHRISASIDPRNTNSIRLLEKIGFRKEAHFLKSLYLNGEWVDDVIYALLSHEWKNTTCNS
jgi:RimJ/RimL family protein N-acetyltransferase